MVRFFDFTRYHGKGTIAGSTHIRVEQLIKYWPGSGIYKYGENPDVLIFQKVYTSEDYRFPEHFKNKKILDICDPDWFDGMTTIKDTVDCMDAVVCSSQALVDFISQMTAKPVRLIKDRFDVDLLPTPKQHSGKAKTVVWFGYAHNAELLKPAIPLIESLGLKLLIISDDDPIAHRWGLKNVQDQYKYIKYNEDTIYDDLQQADFAILPKGDRPQDKFKSENKTVKAQLAGLPVAYDKETVELYMNGAERQAFVDNQWKSVRDEYDVRNSVKEYQELIESL